MKDYRPSTILIIAVGCFLAVLWGASLVCEVGIAIGLDSERVLLISQGGGAAKIELLTGVYQPGMTTWTNGPQPYDGLRFWNNLPNPLVGTTGARIPYQYAVGLFATLVVIIRGLTQNTNEWVKMESE